MPSPILTLDLLPPSRPIWSVRLCASGARAVVLHAAGPVAPPGTGPNIVRAQASVIDLASGSTSIRLDLPDSSCVPGAGPRFVPEDDDQLVAYDGATLHRVKLSTGARRSQRVGRVDAISPSGELVAEVRFRERQRYDSGSRGYTRDGDDLDEPARQRWIDGIKLRTAGDDRSPPIKLTLPFRPHAIAWPCEEVMIVADGQALVAVDLAAETLQHIDGSTAAVCSASLHAKDGAPSVLVASCALSPAGKVDRERVLLVDASSGAVHGELVPGAALKEILVSATGLVASLDQRGELQLWQVATPGEAQMVGSFKLGVLAKFDVAQGVVHGRRTPVVAVAGGGVLQLHRFGPA